MNEIRYGRVSIFPGKHGAGDYRIEFNGIPPTHAETIVMLGAKYIAEDRYNKSWQKGRGMLQEFIARVGIATTFENVLKVAEEVDESIRNNNR